MNSMIIFKRFSNYTHLTTYQPTVAGRRIGVGVSGADESACLRRIASELHAHGLNIDTFDIYEMTHAEGDRRFRTHHHAVKKIYPAASVAHDAKAAEV